MREPSKPWGIYSNDFAHALIEDAGKPYRPSNGTEGDLFDDSYCDNCKRESEYRSKPLEGIPGQGCRILAAVLWNGVESPTYPKEWIYGEDGQPTCTAFEQKES